MRIHGRRIRLRADYGTDEFWLQYHAAVNGELPMQRGKASAGSLAWLIDRYRETPAWTSLSLATRRQRENILRQVIESAGRSPYIKITQKTITEAVIGGARRHFRQGIFSTPCAAYSHGRRKPNS